MVRVLEARSAAVPGEDRAVSPECLFLAAGETAGPWRPSGVAQGIVTAGQSLPARQRAPPASARRAGGLVAPHPRRPARQGVPQDAPHHLAELLRQRARVVAL